MSFLKRNKKSNRTETELISAYRDHSDMEALGDLFQEYMELVYGVCLKYLKNGEQSRDMTMTVFEKVSDKLKTHEVNNFKSWLYVLTKNTCLEWLRKEKRKNIAGENNSAFMHLGDQMHHDNDNEWMDNMDQMEDCVQHLKGLQHECIKMFYYEKMSYQQISKFLDLKEGKVRSSIQNGRRNLKLCMEKKYAKK